MPCNISNLWRRSCLRFAKKTGGIPAAVFLTGLLCLDRASAQISVAVATDQPSYVIGEPVLITISAVNSSAAPVTLRFPSAIQTTYQIDSYRPPLIGGQVFTQVIVPANGAFNWEYYHSWNSYNLDIGSHFVFGSLRDFIHRQSSAPVSFQILPSDPVMNDVFIDFENYPDGTPVRAPDGSIEAPFSSVSYAASGVRFSSDGGQLRIFRFGPTGTNNVLRSYLGNTPWNIIADFDMPVLAVSADVGADEGQSVVMSAFDAAGNLLGAVTSDPTMNYPSLVGPLEFTSQTPIASVKWTTSDPESSVRIDNLRLDVVAVPEPSTIVLVMIGLVGLLSGLGVRNRLP